MPLLNWATQRLTSESMIRRAHHQALCANFDSAGDFASSRIRKSIEDSIFLALWTTWSLMARCVSLAESDILMAELIITLSSTIGVFEISLDQQDGMYDDIIRISYRYRVLLGELYNTQSKMAMLCTTTSMRRQGPPSRVDILEAAEDDLNEISTRLRLLWTKKTFLTRCKDLILALSWFRSGTSPNLPTGNFQIFDENISRRQESRYPSTPPTYSGNIEEDWDEQVGESCTSGQMRRTAHP